MTSTAPLHRFAPIQPIDAPPEELAKRLDGLGVPRPAITPGNDESHGPQSDTASDSGPAKVRQRRGDPNAKPTPRHKLRKVSLQIPEYVWDELHERARKQRCSMRHVIMKALRSNGITINDPDMIEDGRKLR